MLKLRQLKFTRLHAEVLTQAWIKADLNKTKIQKVET